MRPPQKAMLLLALLQGDHLPGGVGEAGYRIQVTGGVLYLRDYILDESLISW